MTSEARAARADMKQVPADPVRRAAIRRAAVAVTADAPPEIPARAALEGWGRAALAALALPASYLGFAMVAANNAFWQRAFSAVPFARRLLLLPRCLRDAAGCAGRADSVGLQCAGCRRCDIAGIQADAEALGYQVVVAEGVSAVLTRVLEGAADAILGVACLDALEKSYARVADLGIPNVAVPLLNDGCLATEAEWDDVRAWLSAATDEPAPRIRGYVPLLRETTAIFSEASLAALLGPAPPEDDPLTATEAIARAWLRAGGKRLRPFVTVAACAVGRHGRDALEPDAPMALLAPPAVRRLAVAIEALHKASLAHDDIEDGEAERYGAPTLHRRYGVGPAINIGDYLVGLGYRLVAGDAAAFGVEAVREMLAALAAAHLDLCRGQGAELLQRGRAATPVDVLAIYAMKTAPAFEAALSLGLRAAGLTPDAALLKRFALYLGEGYQIADDLREWRGERDDGRLARELAAGVPTILWAFARERDDGRLARELAGDDPPARVARVRELYTELGVFAQAERLRDRLRARALALLADCADPALAALLTFLTRVILPEERWTAESRG